MSPAFKRGFTLIELLVVIAIIGVLSSVVLASMNSARAKAYKAAGLESGHTILNAVASCDLDGGKINAPNSATAPTNNFCSTGVGGTWPNPPTGWQWYQYTWISGSENLMYMTSTTNGDAIHCGYYPPWAPYCPPTYPNTPGLCRGASTYTCTYYNSATGWWE